MKRACVIGAGLGGLALAIRLQSSGIETVLVEARDRPGGCAAGWQLDGFTGDTGAAVIAAPGHLHELWQLSGADMASDVELLPIAPFCRFSWPDGGHFDLSGDEKVLMAEIARIAPGDLAGYEEFAEYAGELNAEGFRNQARAAFQKPMDMLGLLPAALRLQAWRSLYGRVSGFVKSERLREALTCQVLMLGGNPLTISAAYALAHKRDKDDSLWAAKGGMGALVAGLTALFERLGGKLRLGDGVVQVHALGNRVGEVECASGWRERFDAVASNADLMHSYRELLAGSARGPAAAKRLARKHWSPGLFSVHFAIDGAWPGIPQQTVMLGARYRGWLDDLFEHGVLPRDGIIMLYHPTVTDPTLAPPGKSLFQAVLPVPHLGRLAIDWAEVGPQLETRILREVGLRFIPDIEDRIVWRRHNSPADHAAALNAWQGSAFSLEPLLSQSAWFRPHHRDAVIGNFYLVGAGVHPGAGVAGVFAGAQVTARLMLEDLAK